MNSIDRSVLELIEMTFLLILVKSSAVLEMIEACGYSYLFSSFMYYL